MAHTHGNEYQVRIVHEDGTEELSGWMQSEAQVAPAWRRSAAPRHRVLAAGAQVLCPDCLEREQGIWECPLTGIPSSRYRPTTPGICSPRGEGTDRGAPHRRAMPAREPTTLYSMVIEIVTASQRAA